MAWEYPAAFAAPGGFEALSEPVRRLAGTWAAAELAPDAIDTYKELSPMSYLIKQTLVVDNPNTRGSNVAYQPLYLDTHRDGRPGWGPRSHALVFPSSGEAAAMLREVGGPELGPSSVEPDTRHWLVRKLFPRKPAPLASRQTFVCELEEVT